MSVKSNRLETLQKKFDMAEETVEQMTTQIEVISEEDDLSQLTTTEIKQPGEHLPESVFEEVFTLDLLKQDFMSMRSSILSLISRGKTILDDTGRLDIADMKASQLEALAALQKSTGENIKLLMGIYKDIVAVEKDKYVILRGLNQENLGMQTQGNIQVGQVAQVTQNVIIAGGTHDILALMEKAKEETNGT